MINDVCDLKLIVECWNEDLNHNKPVKNYAGEEI